MKQVKYKLLLLAGLLPLSASMISGCTEDLGTELTSKRIMLAVDDLGFDGSRSVTRGAKVTSISSFGVSAAVYDASASYTSAGCGSYFYKQSATNGSPLGFFWPTADYKLAFYAYYPYGNAAFTVQSSAVSTGAPTYSYTVPSAIASQVDVMTGQTVNVLGGGSSPVAISMKHRCAAICFSVTNDRSSAITLSSISIEGVKYSGTLCEETWTLSSAVNSSSVNPFTLSYGSSIAAGATVNVTGTSNIFLMLPQSIPAGAKVKVSIAGEDPMYADLSGSWVAGKQYNYSLNVSSFLEVHNGTEVIDWEPAPIDLSMVDNAGNARASRTTANCYMVHAAGKYIVPLVYGNAIKDGTVNSNAYSNSIFVNHINNPITGPWITKNGTGIDAGMGLTATSAELLWQDSYDLINSVSIDGDYLKFSIKNYSKGNAVIAVKNSSGDIMWSWHIWATDETYDTTIQVSGYHVASTHLGWIATSSDGKHGYCPYYQWGRKDPEIPSTGTGNTIHPAWDISGSSRDMTQKTFTTAGSTSDKGNISNGIKYPLYHYLNNISNNDKRYNWIATVNNTYMLWDSNSPSVDNNRSVPTRKTIYDPCPPGFCVPSSGLLYYMTNTISTHTEDSYGYTWNDILYIPKTGYRNYNSVSLTDVTTSAYFWSSTPYNTNTHSYSFKAVGSDTYMEGGSANAFGYPIRPVMEE